MQGDAYSDSRIKDASFAELEVQLLSKHAVSGSPQMLSELSDAELAAHKARLHAGKARLKARLKAELATFDGELAGVDAEERTRESARVRDLVSFSLLSKNELVAFEKRFPYFCCPLCTSPLP